MRKWMRERMQRRKKDSDEIKKEPGAPPLQPAYFDSESQNESSPTTATEAPAPSNTRSPHSAADDPHVAAERSPASADYDPATEEIEDGDVDGNSVDGASENAVSPASKDAPARRRRRGRGGRGRGSSQRSASPLASSGSPEAAIDSGIATPGASPHQDTKTGPQESAGVAARASKGAVILAIGLPGSGKSSWFKRHSVTPLSSDMLRALLFDDPTEQRFQDLIFSNLRSMLKARLIARRPINYVDATNLTPHERSSWIKLGKDYGYEVQAVFFDVPLEVCLERNRKRERVVAEDVMRRMAGKLRPPTFEEGFSKITVVRVKQKS